MRDFTQLTERFVRSLPSQRSYKQRYKEERRLICEKGFEECFHQVRDVLDISTKKKIPHLLRGSGSSSLVSYLLGFTHIDPVKEDMALERFMNDFRDKQPDIDIDFPHWARDRIIEKLKEQYPNRVARISNKVTFQERSALKHAMKANGISGFLPRDATPEDYVSDPARLRKIYQDAAELEGKHRHWSLHCGGVVIFPDKVPEDLKIGPDQVAITKDEVEDLGLIKIDLLCNRGLSQLVDISKMDWSKYPYEDDQIAALLAEGDVIGLTQGESRTMRKCFRAMRPKNYHDVARCLALIRPAAADGGRKAAYFRDHENTRMMIYDDDTIFYIAELLGCSLGKADWYRRAFKKKRLTDVESFFENRDTKRASATFDSQLNELHKYSYCKGHALAYGQLVWALAYQKVYNPKKFWRSALKNCQSSYRRWVHTREAVCAGAIRPKKRSKVYSFLENKKWLSPDFLPGCYLNRKGNEAHFCGIIANMRKLWIDGDCFRFITIGYGNQQYVDLVVEGHDARSHFHRVEGRGRWVVQHGTPCIRVDEIRCADYPPQFEQLKIPFGR